MDSTSSHFEGTSTPTKVSTPVSQHSKPVAAQSNSSSRKRVSQACHRCRARKDKCDGRRPTCSACISRNQACSYDPGIRKRGLPEGYVRDLETYGHGLEEYVHDLEMALMMLIKVNPGAQDTVFSQDTQRGGSERFSKVLRDDDAAATLRNDWKKTRAFQELRKRHPVMETVEKKLGKRKRGSGDTTEEMNAGNEKDMHPHSFIFSRVDALLHKDKDLQKDDVGESTLPSVNHSMTFRPAISVLPSRSWHLLDIYFTHTHSWLPIMDKNDILRAFHQFQQHSRKGSETLVGPALSGPQAALWSILAYSDIQHTGIENTTGKVAEGQFLTPQELYAHARSLIPMEDGDFEIGHVQALVVLSLLNLGLNKLEAAWLLVGQAVRVAAQLGLNRHKTIATQPLKSNITKLETRVFLGCFVVDTMISARLNRCPQLGVEDIDSIGEVVEENGLEEWDPWIDCLGKGKETNPTSIGPPLIFSTFNRLVGVLRTLNDVLHHGPQDFDQESHSKRLTKQLNKDNAQNEEVPQLRTGYASTETLLLPHHINFHLTHLTTSLVLRSKAVPCFHTQINGHELDAAVLDLMKQILELLKTYEATYGLLIAPPILEYSFSVLCESSRLIDYVNFAAMSNSHTLDAGWRPTMLDYCDTLQKVWPIFGSLHQTLEQECIVDTTLDMPEASSDFAFVPDLYTIGSHFNKPYTLDDLKSTLRNHYKPDGNNPLSEGTKLDNAELSAQPGLAQTFNDGTYTQVGPPIDVSVETSVNRTSSLLSPTAQHNIISFADESTTIPSTAEHSVGPMSPLQYDLGFDQDAIFNEFTTVDAMEWYVCRMTTKLSLRMKLALTW